MSITYRRMNEVLSRESREESAQWDAVDVFRVGWAQDSFAQYQLTGQGFPADARPGLLDIWTGMDSVPRDIRQRFRLLSALFAERLPIDE